MGIVSRLKRLWALSDEQLIAPEPVVLREDIPYSVDADEDTGFLPIAAGKPIGAATVVPDDPLDIFPSDDEPEQEQTE